MRLLVPSVDATIRRLQTERSSIEEDANGESCWVVTASTPPFLITAASPGWHRLWGFSKKDVSGQSTRILNGPGHDAKAAEDLGRQYMVNGSASMRCRNTSREGAVLSHEIELTKLEDGCLAISRNLILIRSGNSEAEWLSLYSRLGRQSALKTTAAFLTSVSATETTRSQAARHEAAWTLLCNHDHVTSDLINPSVSHGIQGMPLIQRKLKCLSPDKGPVVDRFLLEVTRRLLGYAASTSEVSSNAQVWGAAAEFLAVRVQAKEEEVPGVAPDMSTGAAVALRTVLAELYRSLSSEIAQLTSATYTYTPTVKQSCWTPRSVGCKCLRPAEVRAPTWCAPTTHEWKQALDARAKIHRTVLRALQQMDATYESRRGVIIVRGRASNGDCAAGLPLAPLPQEASSVELEQSPMNPEVEAMLDNILNALPNTVLFSIAINQQHDSCLWQIQVRRLRGSVLVLKEICSELFDQLNELHEPDELNEPDELDERIGCPEKRARVLPAESSRG
eukprot:CAMPEP_0174697266 /NCGR_PEP_ID=MMETSP1094-20130205/3169_1 /TAXON_ID=156173 /ORGANISM="Chrysochromulina brevifilum, Strain UTEX LB 985" /LENGTH=505 /DNA_ID=CAMNT_0015894205 /DNA_START=6 /DNA_END=1523 /DNA_ORIENTATION=+